MRKPSFFLSYVLLSLTLNLYLPQVQIHFFGAEIRVVLLAPKLLEYIFNFMFIPFRNFSSSFITSQFFFSARHDRWRRASGGLERQTSLWKPIMWANYGWISYAMFDDILWCQFENLPFFLSCLGGNFFGGLLSAAAWKPMVLMAT